MYKPLSITAAIILAISITACNRIDPKDITVIDGARLGLDLRAFYSQLDSLKVPQESFYTKTMTKDLSEVLSSQIKFYRTDLFNTSKYSSSLTNHYGIYYPITIEGTKNVVGVNILLVHTDNALVFTDHGLINVSKETQTPLINQDISAAQVSEIEDMLATKYGKPIDTMHFYLNPFYVIQGTDIQTYHCDSTNVGDIVLWKTPYYDVRFFTGVLSSSETFKNDGHTYFTYFDNNPFRPINYSDGERQCRSFVYIQYQLNSEAEKKLELTNAKL